jgi:hypothetical protein
VSAHSGLTARAFFQVAAGIVPRALLAHKEKLIYLVIVQMWIQLLLLSKTITQTKSLQVRVAVDS